MLSTGPAPSLQPMPDVMLVQRLFQGILSYQIKDVERKSGPEKAQCFLKSLASCPWGAAPGSGVQGGA